MRTVLLLSLLALATLFANAEQVHTLTRQGKLAELQALIAQDATLVNQPDMQQKGRTAIFDALTPERLDILRVLIAAGADVNYRDMDGITPLLFYPHPEASDLLLKAGADINAVPYTQVAHPLLIQAVRAGNIERLRALLARGANIDVRGYGDGNSALHIAAGMEDGTNVDPVSGKWKSGFGMVDPNTGKAAWTPGIAAIITLLLDHGADIESRNAIGETPLWKSVNRGMLVHTRLLLKRGANSIAITAGGKPILFAAATPELLDLFVKEMRMNPDIPNMLTGLTYLQSLRPRPERQAIETQKLLKERGATDDGSKIPEAFKTQMTAFAQFMDTVRRDDIDGVTQQLTADAKLVNAYQRTGHTWLEQANGPLHEAKSTRMVLLLLQAGADVNRANFAGYTALHLAAQRGNLEIAQCLLEQGANPNARTVNYELPLHGAIHCKKPEMITLLLQHKANPLLRNHSQQTALEKLRTLPTPDPAIMAALEASTK